MGISALGEHGFTESERTGNPDMERKCLGMTLYWMSGVLQPVVEATTNFLCRSLIFEIGSFCTKTRTGRKY
jgi:hypothetical protein